MRIPVVMLLVLGATAASRVACASTYGPDFPYHRIDQAKVGVDVVPPAAPVAEVTKIWRADPPAMLADGQSVWYDNTGLGTLHMRLTGMLDDDTPPELLPSMPPAT